MAPRTAMIQKCYHRVLFYVNKRACTVTSSGKNRMKDDRHSFITMLITLSLRLLCTLMTESSTAPGMKGVVTLFRMEHTPRDHNGSKRANVLKKEASYIILLEEKR
jgi:hypothetical protein